MGVHALWNGSAAFGTYGFYAVYAAFMVPAFALLTWLVIWTSQRELRTIAAELPPTPPPAGCGRPSRPRSPRCGPVRWHGARCAARTKRSVRKRSVRKPGGIRRPGRVPGRRPCRRRVRAFATSLAFLRHRAHRGAVGPDFTARAQELLHHLWQRRDVAGPALEYAARATTRAWAPPPPPWQPQPYSRPSSAPWYGPPPQRSAPHRDHAAYNPYRQQQR